MGAEGSLRPPVIIYGAEGGESSVLILQLLKLQLLLLNRRQPPAVAETRRGGRKGRHMDMEGCEDYHLNLLLLYIIILTLKTQRGKERLAVWVDMWE